MAVNGAALDRLRDDLLAAIRDSEHRIRGEMEHRLTEAISASEARLGARIEASATETRRHMDVVAEDLRSKIALVAEGTITLTERLAAEMRSGFEAIDRRMLRLETRLLLSPPER